MSERETIARIIDPTSFMSVTQWADQYHVMGDRRLAESEYERWSGGREIALRKADAILALSAAPSPVDGGEGSSNASRVAMGSLPHVATEAEPSAVDASTEKPEPNPEWEALADAAHAAILAEVGVSNPFDTLTMLETWKAHAEPADCDGRISFSRAMLDSAQDALRAALEMARSEHLRGKMAFVRGAQECRDMLARFVEQGAPGTRGGLHVLIAQSIRANWNPEWGADPGPPRNMRDHGWLGPALHDKVAALIASPLPLPEPGEGNAAQSQPCGEASADAEVFAGLGAEPSALIERLAYEAMVWAKDPAHNIGADQPSLVFARRFAFLMQQRTKR